MEARPIRFIRRGELVRVGNVPPDRTLLALLREDLGATGTKEGCGEGDCGACTVVVAEPDGGRLRYRAINSCIALAQAVDGKALWTVEDLAAPGGALHPAQEAMVRCHASQCGFCTPGFVMSMFAMYQDHVCRGETVTRELAVEALSGNLCRCTGYRPILDAACGMGGLPKVEVDEAGVLSLLRTLRPTDTAPAPPSRSAAGAANAGEVDAAGVGATVSLRSLLDARARNPQAQVVAGTTDVGLWITKLHKQYSQVIDVTRCDELRGIARSERAIVIGAAATLTDAFAALVEDRPELKTFANRFAGLPVRNAGTLGGNIANGSPIGDSMPLLIALDARLVLSSVRGTRDLAVEDFYTGYRANVLAADELLTHIEVPRPSEGEILRAYKISKRFDDDISAVCLVIAMALEGGNVARVRIGAGGVAATPDRARRTEAALLGQPWTQQAAQRAADALRAEFQPISDMRASSEYRSFVLGNLMQRFWLETQGVRGINLEVLPA